MFKAKPYVKVGTGECIAIIPRPPKYATHAVLTMHNDLKENGKPKTATLPIQDFGCFKGVSGSFHYIRMDNRRKVHEEYKESWKWNGREVEGIEQLLEQ